MLRDFAAHVRSRHLRVMAEAYVQRCREAGLPVPEALANCGPAEHLAYVEAWLEHFLLALEGRELTPLTPEELTPLDLHHVALAHALRRELLLGFLAGYATGVEDVVAIMNELDRLLLVAQQPILTRLAQEREEAEARRQLEVLKGRILGVVSHELRTPLNSIMGFGSILEDGLAGPVSPEQRRYLAKIAEGTEALLAQIDVLLDLAQVHAGTFSLRLEPVSVHEVVTTVLGWHEAMARLHRHTLVVALPGKLPTIAGDGRRLTLMISHLVGNAIKFVPPGGTIRLATRVAGGELSIVVADDGPGIAPADEERFFKTFSQLDMSATRPSGGSGLGLPYARAMAEAHGGAIRLERPRSKGATFVVTLPVRPPRSLGEERQRFSAKFHETSRPSAT